MGRQKASRKRCVLIAEHLSHYREGVYRELDADPVWDFTFIGGNRVKDGSILGVPPGILKRRLNIRNNRLPGSILWQSGIIKLSLQTDIDAAIFTGNVRYLTTWICGAILRLRGVHVLFWTTGWHTRDSNKITRAVRKLFYGIAHRLLLYGEDGREIALSEGLPPNKLHVIGNSYSQTASASEENIMNGSILLPPKVEGRRYVGAVIRLNPIKRFSLLIEAIAILRAKGEDVSLLLVGEGSDDETLRAHAEKYNVPLHLPGSIHDAEAIKKVYELLEVTVVPEYAGLTTIQSLEHGTPVVTTRDAEVQAPEFRAVIPGRTGELYDKNDANSLAKAIRQVLISLDYNKQSIKAACQQESTQNWSPEAHAQRILDVLSTEVNTRRDKREKPKKKS